VQEKTKKELLQKLAVLYPEPRSELNFSSDFELIISVVLSAQCTDKKVNQTTPALFKRFGSFRKLAKAHVEDVEQIIREVNYYRTKSKNIIELSRMVVEQFGDELPSTMEELIQLPGVGRKTANVVLGERGITPSIAVDTHVFRVSRRLGIAKGENVRDVEESLMKNFAPEVWRDLHHQLIFHGRRVCKARNPLCGSCELSDLCPSRQAT